MGQLEAQPSQLDPKLHIELLDGVELGLDDTSWPSLLTRDSA